MELRLKKFGYLGGTGKCWNPPLVLEWRKQHWQRARNATVILSRGQEEHTLICYGKLLFFGGSLPKLDAGPI